MGDLADSIDSPAISIIVPTLNEGAYIGATLASARDPRVVERIVVDGGSADDTVERARECGARVLESAAGRAHQLNTGAAASRGEILVFLHGDTCLPSGFASEVACVLAGDRTVAGAFPIRLDAQGFSYRVIERGANVRSRVFQLPYGDQALFMNREIFARVGGFPEQPLMEDYELVRELRRRGRIGLAQKPVITSARRWRKLGAIKTTLINQMVVLGYSLGASPARLAVLYGRREGKR